MPVIPAERISFAPITPGDWATNPRDVAGALAELAARNSGDLDLQLNKLYLDADQDTYLYAAADDLPVLVAGGTTIWSATVAGIVAGVPLKMSAQALLLDGDGDTGVASAGDDILDWKFNNQLSMTFALDLIHGYDTAIGDGRDLNFRGGDSGGGDGDGGDLNLEAGAKNGSGADGSVNLRKADGTDVIGVAATGGLYIKALAAKGDLLVASADDTPARLSVGSDGEILEADAGESVGAKWAVPMQLVALPFNERLGNRSGTHNLQAIGCDTDFGRNNRAVLLEAGTVIGFTYRMQVVTATSGQLDFALWVNDVWNSVMVSQLASSGTGYFAIRTAGLSVAFVAGGELAVRVVETGTMVWGPIWGLLWVKMRA